jgi:SAM-dependent methyltransferase
MPAGEIYDTIGRNYTRQRRPDARIAAALTQALGTARSVLNVGAGAGSYEPIDRRVIAVEPSRLMLAQRNRASPPAVQARAEALPFASGSFDAVMAVLTIHHWSDHVRGLRECHRVARHRVVLMTFDAEADGFWLTEDYFPQFKEADRRQFPRIRDYAKAFGGAAHVQVVPLPIPQDCVDGFLGAFWARPHAYLDAAVQSGISSFACSDIEAGVKQLRADLACGAWHARYGHLLSMQTLDVGYRLVIAEKMREALQQQRVRK